MLEPVSKNLHAGAGPHGPVTLMYHSVVSGAGRPDWPWAVSMHAFCEQLDVLAAEGYATPTIGELVANPGLSGAGRTAVITFDDGYVDNLAACDELQRRGMHATPGSWFRVRSVKDLRSPGMVALAAACLTSRNFATCRP